MEREYIDRNELLYQRGEVLSKQIWLKEQIEDIEYALKSAKASERRTLKTDIETLRAYITELEGYIMRYDELIPQFENYDDAVGFMKREFDNGKMQGLIGYTNLYRTESRFDAEHMEKAARSTGTRFRRRSWTDGYYALELRFKVSTIVLVESIDDEE